MTVRYLDPQNGVSGGRFSLRNSPVPCHHCGRLIHSGFYFIAEWLSIPDWRLCGDCVIVERTK